MSDNNISLVVLAAGMGSRYGGLKQLDELGPNGETILDYSVFDAINAGFTKVVFVIRDFFAEDFKQKIGDKFKNKIDVRYVLQDVNPQFNFLDVELNREKPWGTNHAVLVTKEEIHEPFAVINADDYYGKEGFVKMANFLKDGVGETEYAMIGYRIKNTLSDSGSVNRGVCSDKDGYLLDIVETLKISKELNGDYVSRPGDGSEKQVAANSTVSMNFWGFHPNYLAHCEAGFEAFVKANYELPKAEYFIPLLVDDLIKSKTAKVRVITTEDRWYGVTYKEDANEVKGAFKRFHQEGKYPKLLWT